MVREVRRVRGDGAEAAGAGVVENVAANGRQTERW